MSFKNAFEDFDWSTATADQQLARVRACTDPEIRQLARCYDWGMHPQTVLSWIMAQKCVDLGTALTAFLNGQPERLNYLPKRDVPKDLQGAAQVLDTICLRLNSGFYLVWPDQDVTDRARITRWLDQQADDRLNGRQGRFILDEAIVATLLNNDLRLGPDKETSVYAKRASLLRDIFSPVLELGVSRQFLRYHPQQDDPNDDLTHLKY